MQIANLCKRIKDGVNVSEELNYYSDIVKVGPGGHFLKQKNTRKASRSNEFYTPQIIDRNTYSVWEELGRPDLYSNARKKVQEILNSERKNPLDKDVEKTIEEIMSAAGRELA